MTTEELNALIAQAEGGDVVAMNQLTHIYGEEDGFINHEQAAKWFLTLIQKDCDPNSDVYEKTGYNKDLYEKVKNTILNSASESDMLSLPGCPSGGSLLGGSISFTSSNAKTYIYQAEETIKQNILYKKEEERIRNFIERPNIFDKSRFEKFRPEGHYVIPEGVRIIGATAFQNRDKLISVEIPRSVTIISQRAFEGCLNLTSVTIPRGVRAIEEEAFKDCKNLKTVILHSGITNIGNRAFYGCNQLSSMELPSGVKKIGYNAFERCIRLTELEIPSSVTSIGTHVFDYCIKLEKLKVPKGTKQRYARLLGYKYASKIVEE